MINDTPKSPKPRITQNIKPGPKTAYQGGFHLKTTEKRKNSASKRSSAQTFTCG